MRLTNGVAAMDTTGTSWAVTQFGEHAEEVSRRVVQALTSAQEVGTRTQRASGQSRRYAYGSTWTSKYEQLVYQFTEALGEDLPPVQLVEVPGAPYDLVEVNGRLLIPFVLARSLADVPDRPKLSSDILRALAARTVPPPVPEPSLFDLFDEPDVDPSTRVPAPRLSPEISSAAEETDDEAADDGVDGHETDGLAPVFIGVVCNADTESPLDMTWGAAESIDDDGVLVWSPEQLSLELADASDGLRPVPEPRESHEVGAFDEGAAPELTVTARPRPVDPDTPSPTPDDGLQQRDGQQRGAVGETDE